MTLLLVAWTGFVTSARWEPGVWHPCDECHPITPVVAAETINPTACLSCHSPRFPPPIPTAEEAHLAHTTEPVADPDEHPSPEEAAAVGKDIRNCPECHFRIEGEMCMIACHAENMPHVGGRTDCETCHGAIDEIRVPEPSEVHAIELERHDKLGVGVGACLVCHDEAQRTMLRLADGRLLSFDEAPKLCWQCHHEVYYMWKDGEHYSPEVTCTAAACHNPHRPYLGDIPPKVEYVEVPVGISIELAVAIALAAAAIVGVVVGLTARRSS